MGWLHFPSGGGGGGGGGATDAADLTVDATGHTVLTGTDAQTEFDEADAALAGLSIPDAGGVAADPTGHTVLTGDTVQGELDDADTAIAGILATPPPTADDVSANVDTHGTLLGDSVQAQLDEADSSLVSLTATVGSITGADVLTFKGILDASSNPNYPAGNAGDVWRISVAGKIGGASGINVEVGDTLYCLTDGTSAGNQATVGSHWQIMQANIDGAVVGPASSTDLRVAVFSGTTGKIIADGGTLLSALALASDLTAEILARKQVAVIRTVSTSGDLQAADRGGIVESTSATGITISAQTSIHSAGDVIELFQDGAGQITVAAGSGMTMRAPGGAKTRVQYSSVRVWFLSATEFKVDGDTTT